MAALRCMSGVDRPRTPAAAAAAALGEATGEETAGIRAGTGSTLGEALPAALPASCVNTKTSAGGGATGRPLLLVAHSGVEVATASVEAGTAGPASAAATAISLSGAGTASAVLSDACCSPWRATTTGVVSAPAGVGCGAGAAAVGAGAAGGDKCSWLVDGFIPALGLVASATWLLNAASSSRWMPSTNSAT